MPTLGAKLPYSRVEGLFTLRELHKSGGCACQGARHEEITFTRLAINTGETTQSSKGYCSEVEKDLELPNADRRST